MDNEYLQEQKKKREKLFGYIFLAWFICSFIGFDVLKKGERKNEFVKNA